jgi:hypothetical protein
MIQLAVENNRQHSNKSILGFHQNVKYLSIVRKGSATSRRYYDYFL